MQQTNEELQEKAALLARQKAEVEAKNREVEEARWEMEEKAEQLALTSKYKSEFLANMSHELRTPLNSMLILSRQLAENTDENLSDKQVQFAETIHSSGSDLLSLINDILDLSKIESGMMGIEVSEVSVDRMAEQLQRSFHQLAQDKNLEFQIERAEDFEPTLRTDDKRVQQILINLLSNAFKFTHEGKVVLRIAPAPKDETYHLESLNRTGEVVAFSVTDTGIGIPTEKQRIIFEPFQQADGTTSRKYGGTGLGLSISREIARLLGGEIRMLSTPGEGSTFTFYLPRNYVPVGATTAPSREPRASDVKEIAAAWTPVGGFDAEALLASSSSAILDDRNDLQSGDRVVLIVEDDISFAGILLDLAREKGFKALVATNGMMALALAQKYKPAAITLDIRLPDRDGWTVLDRLKHDPATRHIPVHIITVEEERQRALKQGAFNHVQKPVTREVLDKAFSDMGDFAERRVRKLLVVEDDDVQRMSVVELIGNGDVQTTAVATGGEALNILKDERFDCMVLDLKLPDMSGFDLIEKLQTDLGRYDLPIIIYTGKELTRKEELHLKKVTDAIIVKEASSPERLLAETALFLHRVEADLPETKRRMLEKFHRNDPVLAGRKVLVVDDDVRNIFALTSALEAHNMEVIHAENGQEGIDLLKAAPGVEAVLMDIMMPEMDGYEAITAIRQMEDFKQLPIIALTAKAMKADRDHCLEVGASDYISKPLDIDQLLSLLRVWLYKPEETQ